MFKQEQNLSADVGNMAMALLLFISCFVAAPIVCGGFLCWVSVLWRRVKPV